MSNINETWEGRSEVKKETQGDRLMCLAQLRTFIQETNTQKHIFYPSFPNDEINSSSSEVFKMTKNF